MWHEIALIYSCHARLPLLVSVVLLLQLSVWYVGGAVAAWGVCLNMQKTAVRRSVWLLSMQQFLHYLCICLLLSLSLYPPACGMLQALCAPNWMWAN